MWIVQRRRRSYQFEGGDGRPLRRQDGEGREERCGDKLVHAQLRRDVLRQQVQLRGFEILLSLKIEQRTC
jgi:hypothetical protein